MYELNNSKRAVALLVGDLVVYVFSLILTLTIRYGQLPTRSLLADHIMAFLVLFVFFALIGFIIGIYDKQSSFLRAKFQGILVKAQIVNIFFGIAFFYLAPVIITPKANLAIFFVVSTVFLFVWRAVMFPVLSSSKPQPAILVGDGIDVDDLYHEVNAGMRYGLVFKDKIRPDDENQLDERIIDSLGKTGAKIIVADFHDKKVESVMPVLYSRILAGNHIINASKLYEEIFDRIPLSMVGEKWFVENAMTAFGNKRVFDIAKRLMDICISFFILIPLLVIYPFVYLAIKINDGGRIFINQTRIGKNGKLIKMAKFRSMTADDGGAYGQNGGKTKLKVTKVGKFIRLTRIDELPQIFSVMKGDQSLIGPRPELPDLVRVYEKEIPHYGIRHSIKPGLSGWAQIYHRAHPHHAIAVDDTRDKLSYDLYYLKNRSIMLDLRIALQTAKALLSRQGV